MAHGTILVVDDDPDIVRVVSMRLKSAGYETLSACDGREATLLALSAAPDLIILDIGMPNGDGHTVAQHLLAYADTQGTPILFLTARTTAADQTKAHQAGATVYITKPFQSEHLLDMVAKSLFCSRQIPRLPVPTPVPIPAG